MTDLIWQTSLNDESNFNDADIDEEFIHEYKILVEKIPQELLDKTQDCYNNFENKHNLQNTIWVSLHRDDEVCIHACRKFLLLDSSEKEKIPVLRCLISSYDNLRNKDSLTLGETVIGNCQENPVRLWQG